MNAHSQECRSRIETTVEVPMPADEMGRWAPCRDLSQILGAPIVRSCDDVRAVLASEGIVIANLMKKRRHSRFRLWARDRRTNLWVASVEWTMYDCGSWEPVDEVTLACEFGRVFPGTGADGPALLAA
ncbi:hypothetical protein I5Q34_19745 [Streptomyces sp. AV19]|uniref:hypothetical protein n=1 Tax=Streptomyces sp. AV19 TaxID=2793068 RepID=UPI0018FE3C30|nr:hypothetical protein [Streptomyces sp. AV19]MBH1936482.1 hypothetical protein [Streptomyces sp. AV19]MDG4532539.1 hypothetical protein [Streptomyces sp. AV19]